MLEYPVYKQDILIISMSPQKSMNTKMSTLLQL